MPAHSPIPDDNELLLIAPPPPVIAPETVIVLCRRVHKYYFPSYRRWSLVFDFSIAEPTDLADEPLQMFVRYNPKWKYLPQHSKIYKLAWLANPHGLCHRQKVTKTLFENKLFRAMTRIVSPDYGPSYSIVDNLIERLTG